MGLYQRGAGWQIKLTVKGRTHREQFDGTKEEATIREGVIRNALKTGAPIPSLQKLQQDITLVEAVELTHKKYWAKTANGGKNVLSNVMRLVDRFPSRGNIPITTVTEEMFVQAVEDCRKESLSPRTINYRLRRLRRVMGYCFRRGWIAQDIEVVYESERGIDGQRFLSQEEASDILAFLRERKYEEMRDITMVALDTGMRIGEIRALEPMHISFTQNRITVMGTKSQNGEEVGPTKTGLIRKQPMTPRVKEVMKRRVAEVKRTKAQWLFPISYQKATRIWNYAREALDIKDDKETTFHITRHTCASWMAQRGVQLLLISKYLGHTNINTTMRYAHLCEDDLDFGMQQLADLEESQKPSDSLDKYVTGDEIGDEIVTSVTTH